MWNPGGMCLHARYKRGTRDLTEAQGTSVNPNPISFKRSKVFSYNHGTSVKLNGEKVSLPRRCSWACLGRNA